MNPILLLHGALGASSQLASLKRLLVEAGRQVHLVDFSGHHGVPFSSSFGIEVFADDVLSMMNSHPFNICDIFGYSMGGYVAVWLAFTHPHRIGRIVTLGTKFDWSPESAKREVKKLDAEKIQEKIPAFARLLESRHAPNDWKELLNRTRTMMLALGKKPLLTKDSLQSINHSVTFCLGDQDDMADRLYTEDVCRWLPKGEFVLLPDTPHPIEKVDLEPLTEIILRSR